MTMSKTILITRPDHDETTDYLNKWSEPVKNLAQDKKFTVLDLQGKKASRKNLESYTKKNSPNLFFFNGHGSDSIIGGQDNEHLLVSDDNDELCNNAVVYIRSCSAGKKLGKSLVAKGAKACICYTTKFGFLRLLTYATRPLMDPLAKIFLEPSNIVAMALIKDNTALEAHQRSNKEMKKSLYKLLSSESGQSDPNAIVILWSNIRGQTLLGDESATI